MIGSDILVEQVRGDADLDTVAELEARCFTNPWTREMLARELAISNVAHIFVLRLPERPVAAFCSCWIVSDELHINTLAVNPACRRIGLASHLMREVMGEAARRGARRATLEVRESNAAARGLYERLGFRVAGVRRNYYTDPVEDAIILWRNELPGPAAPEA